MATMAITAVLRTITVLPMVIMATGDIITTAVQVIMDHTAGVHITAVGVPATAVINQSI